MNINSNSTFVVLEGNKIFQTNEYREIVKKLISKDFYELPRNERQKEIKKVAAANSAFNDLTIRDSYTKGEDVSRAIYTCDEKAYILSLVNSNLIWLFERIDSHTFAKGITAASYEKNYCVINTYAEKLLKNHLNREKGEIDR